MHRPIVLALALSLVLAACSPFGGDGTAGAASTRSGDAEQGDAEQGSTTVPTSEPADPAEPSTETSLPPPDTIPDPPLDRWVDVRTVGRPWGMVSGLTQFRGNPSRTWYGTGPLPTTQPSVKWRFPDEPMCGTSSVGGQTTTWCGTGWTGQPVVWERPDGITEVIFGAYDKKVHFVDAETGVRTRPDFATGDIIKGSVTLDPDGFPLLYFGSRDNKLRVLALDREEPVELWAIDAADYQGIWNNDWDGNPAIVDGVLFEGGENGIFYAVELNRDFDAAGKVVVEPEVLVTLRGWTDELLAAAGDRNASIESSVAILDGRAYFTNSSGRVAGLDITRVRDGEAPIVFDFWAGDDIDATPVLDADGMLYVAIELERFLSRSAEVGQLIKLDPSRPDDPLVWSVAARPTGGGDGGFWATPALHEGHVYAASTIGTLFVVDAMSGEVVDTEPVGPHAWSSPVIVDGTMLVTVDCESGGGIQAYSLADPADPQPLWFMRHGSGCIESTPAVWNGTIYVGSRDGYFYAFE